MESTRVRLDSSTVHLIGACLGLDGEAEAVAEAIEEASPSIVALALDPEMAPEIGELDRAHELGAEDEAYKEGLSEWGSVTLPAPAFPEAVEVAERVDARVEGVDLPQAEYLDRHLDRIGMLDLTKRALRARWLGMRPPKADSPASFCRAFDQRLNDGSFGRLQADRERAMADRLAELATDGTVACVVEIERLEGVTRALRAGDPGAR